MTLPTPEDVLAFGQLTAVYFPRCADEAEILTLLEELIDDAHNLLLQQSPGLAAASGPPLEPIARRVIMHLVLADVFQLVAQVMNSNDPQGLAPELVDPEQAARHRDYHLARARELQAAAATSVTDNPAVAAPVFATVGLDQDSVRTSSLVERWRDTGQRPE